MSDCKGRISVTTKVDAEMRSLLERDAEKLGVYRSEVAREAFDTYRNLREGEFECPHCRQAIEFNL
jgi:hypothetical protein